MSDPIIEQWVPYLPECSGFDEQTFWSKWTSRGQAFNLSNAGDYVLQQIVPSIVPGIVFGVLALVGFLAFTLWATISCCCACCAPCCRRCRRRPPPPPDAAAASQQFLAAGSAQPGASYAYPGPGLEEGKRGCCPSWKKWFWAAFILTGLATVGIAIWGLVASCRLTSHTVSDFWDIVAGVEDRARNTANALQALQVKSAQLSGTSDVLLASQDQVTQALVQQGNLSQPVAAVTVGVLTGASAALREVAPTLQGAVAFLNDTVLSAIDSIQADFEPPTMAVQNTWRFLPIAIIFGLLVLIVLATMVAVWFMTWPRTAALLVALLWLAIALLMLLGTGLLNGVYTVSSDACLYAETFVIDYAKRRVENTQYGGAVVGMIKYYTNRTEPGAGAAGPFPFLPTTNNSAVEAANNSIIKKLEAEGAGVIARLREVGNNPAIGQRIEQVLGPATGRALELAGDAVGALKDAGDAVTDLAAWESVRSLYWQTKDYICCTLKSNMYDMWVAWTVAGCLGFVLALMASGRLIYMARQRRKAFKLSQEAAPGAAVLWTEPPKPSAYSPPDQHLI